jgi:ribonuclease P protein component
MVLIVSPGQEENSRFGVAAGKTVGSAVRRNRAKRLLRNSVSHFLTFIRPGWDVVIIARKPMVEATLEQTQSALRLLFLRAGLIDETYEARIE